MLNWIVSPQSASVAQFIEHYWCIEKTPDDEGVAYPILNPDPAGHYIIADEALPYSYQNQTQTKVGKGSHLLFPNLQSWQLDHSSPFIILGIKFRIGAFYTIEISDFPHPIIDNVVSMSPKELLDVENEAIPKLLQLAKEKPDECINALDSKLTPWLSQYQQDKHAILAQKAAAELRDGPISELANILHCSSRTLERTFRKVTGFTLKQCQSMFRLEDILEYLHQIDKRDIEWIDVAQQFGFSDQPHLIRYLQSHLGLSPTQYANKRSLTIDAYGGISQFKSEV